MIGLLTESRFSMNKETSHQETAASTASADQQPWYAGVTAYQWLVLAIASAGWVFDVFEGQLFGSCMNDALRVLPTTEILPSVLNAVGLGTGKEIYINLGLGAFLAGGAFGGVLFGMLADRWGRKWTMSLTILMYSIFTGLTALSPTVDLLIVLRFLVGMGVGGEWAVAAAIVAEVFPQRARPAASGIFHASSVLGTYMAVGTLLLVGVLMKVYPQDGWRFGFLLGIVPALLILAVRVYMREPETWQSAKVHSAEGKSQRLGRFTDLFSTPTLIRNSVIGASLAIIGLATFWGAHFRGRDIVRIAAENQQRSQLSSAAESSAVQIDTILVNRYAAFGWFLVTTGGGIGLLSFAPISQRIGRRMAFVFFHVGGLLMTLAVFLLADGLFSLLPILPVFGFFTLGMHAGYAIYFPELYPTRLRSTGAGFCFNMARIVVVPVLLLFGWLQSRVGLSLVQAMLVLSSLFLVGAVLALLGPETRGQPLPE